MMKRYLQFIVLLIIEVTIETDSEFDSHFGYYIEHVWKYPEYFPISQNHHQANTKIITFKNPYVYSQTLYEQYYFALFSNKNPFTKIQLKYNHLFDQYGKVDVKYEENKAYQISKEKYNSPIVMSDFSSETPNTVLLLIKSCYDNDDLIFKVNSILSNETAQSVKLNSNYQ